MALPVWTAGQVLTAADVNKWFVPQLVVKGSDQSVTSSTTLVSDTALVLPLAANTLYNFDLSLLIVANDTAQFKMQLTGPAGATALGGIMGFNTGASFGASSRGLANPVTFTGNGATVAPLWWRGTVQSAGTAGNFQFQWAQNTSNGTACTVKAGSSMTLIAAG